IRQPCPTQSSLAGSSRHGRGNGSRTECGCSWSSAAKSSEAKRSASIGAPFVIVRPRRIIAGRRKVKGWAPKHLDIPDVPIHKANHILRILNSALPGRQLLRLMPGPRENSGSLQSEYRSAGILYRSLLTAEHAGKACFVQERRRRVGTPVAAAELVA